MTPLAQDKLEHGQKVQDSPIDSEKLPESHDSQQGVWHLLQPFHLTN